MTTPAQNAYLSAQIQALTQQLISMQRQVQQIQRNQRAAQLGSSSIEGGSLTVNDSTGKPQLVFGKQSDGTYNLVAFTGAPGGPPQPDDPQVVTGSLGLYVAWDGEVGGVPPPMNFGGVQVHCSPTAPFTPSTATLQGTMTGAGVFGVGNLTPGQTYYIVLVGVDTAGNTSTSSDTIPAVAGILTGAAIATGSITGANIAANTITAANLIAGIVVAGIVDATTVEAATLIGSTILGYAASTPRGPVLYDFESGTQGWTAYNGSTAQSTTWQSTGLASLALTSSVNGGSYYASAPTGTAGTPITPGEPVAIQFTLYTPTAMTNVYAGVQYYSSAGAEVEEVDLADMAFAAGQQTTVTVTDQAPPGAAYYVPVFGNHSGSSGDVLYGDTIELSGNLAFSATANQSFDNELNLVLQGITVISLPGLTSAFTVIDPFYNVLGRFDSAGNVTGQTISANVDLIVGGQSLINSILPSLPDGILNYGYTPSSWPSTAIQTTETSIMELDVTVTAGRAYRIRVPPVLMNCAANADVFFRLRYTTDGSTPSLSSTVAVANGILGTPSGQQVTHPGIEWYFFPGSNGIYRFLMGCIGFGTTPAITFAASCVMEIEDIGPATTANSGQNATIFGTGTGGGVSKQTYTTSWNALGTYSYFGTAVGGGRRNVNGSMYQGAYSGGFGVDGSQFSLLHFGSVVGTALSGASINWIELQLTNQHFWYDGGGTVLIGWSTRTTFPGSITSFPAGGDHVSVSSEVMTEGQNKTFRISNAIASAFQSSSAVDIIIGNNSTQNLQNYGYFAGGSDPTLTINYTK